jgi:hypothetical protein
MAAVASVSRGANHMEDILRNFDERIRKGK